MSPGVVSYTFTPSAFADLLEIREYLLREGGPAAADRVRLALQAACDRLARTPGIGHIRDDLTRDRRHRFWGVHSYLIVYRPDTSPLEIIRVIHGARDAAALLQDEG